MDRLCYECVYFGYNVMGRGECQHPKFKGGYTHQYSIACNNFKNKK